MTRVSRYGLALTGPRLWAVGLVMSWQLLSGLLFAAAPTTPSPSPSPPLSPSPEPPSWDFVVEVPDLGRGQLAVTWTLRGFGGTRPLRICADMSEAERYVVQIERQDTGKPLPRDGACWLVPDAEPRGVVLAYTYDLRGLASKHDSPDYAQRVGDTYIFNDEAVLLRPDPMPQRTATTAAPAIAVELRLPAGVQVAAPWQRLPGAGWRFSYDGTQFDGGSYVTLGPQEDLGVIALPHTKVQLATLPGPRKLSAAALQSWVRTAMTAVQGFYGPLTPPQVLVTLVPVPGYRDPSVFGTVLRPPHPSVVIYYGGDCEQAETPAEWVAVHELFHIANPRLTRKIPWFTEGFTTYYQDVLRGRAKMLDETATWADLVDGFRRFCQPDAGVSLKDESDRLHSTYHYSRVYWGGACVAFMTDVAIRERSQGKKSLDDVLRELRVQSLRGPLREDQLVAALDQATGTKLVSGLLRERRGVPVRRRLQRLGVEITSPDSIRLRDEAPQSRLRKAIF